MLCNKLCMYRLIWLRQLPSVRTQQMWSSLHSSISSCFESQRPANACLVRAQCLKSLSVSFCVRLWHTSACQSSCSRIAQQARNSHRGHSWLCNSTPAMTVAIESDPMQQQCSCSAPEAAGSAAKAPAQAADAAAILQRLLPEQHVTKLLTVDPAAVPDVSAPDLTSVHEILTAQTAPDLSPSSCPHLYYPHSQPHAQQQGLAACSSSSAIQQAAELLRAGQPVAIPTETVYGLAANALSASAVSAVYAAKGRPSDNPLIVHVSDLDMLAQLYPQQQQQQQQATKDCTSSTNSSSHTNSCRDSSAKLHFIPQQYHRLIAAFWPGPLTLLLPASPLLPAAVTAGLPTVAVRMPAHPVARALIAAAGVPLAAPSANTSGRPSPTTAQHVMQDLAGRVAAVVDGGACGCGVESTVLDGLRSPPVVLRPGGVTAELLGLCPDMQGLQVYQRDFTDKQLEATPTTPGMKYRHYSPTAPLLLLDPTPAWQAQQQQQQQQLDTSGLQQLVVEATQQLLRDIQQAQQQQQQQPCSGSSEQHSASGRQVVVLLSTCSSSSSGSGLQPGWTPASLECIHQQQQEGLAAALKGPGSSSSRESSVQMLEYVLGSWQQPELVAQHMFAALRAADAVCPALIIAQGLPPEGPGLAIMNRLQKAASQHVQVPVGL